MWFARCTAAWLVLVCPPPGRVVLVLVVEVLLEVDVVLAGAAGAVRAGRPAAAFAGAVRGRAPTGAPSPGRCPPLASTTAAAPTSGPTVVSEKKATSKGDRLRWCFTVRSAPGPARRGDRW